jgi:hypothetical protein
MVLNDQLRQLALGGTPVEITDGSQTFYLLSKERYDELERIRTLFAEIEEIEFPPYEADDIVDPNRIVDLNRGE